jgi:P27 family predicted phage terminase small subunit
MKRGPKPKPTARKRFEGNPGKRKLNPREPQLPTPPPARDAPPPEVADDAVASAEWRRLLPLLKSSQTITEGDLSSLVALCQQWSRYLFATGKVTNSGMVVRSPSGYPMPNPYIGISNKALGNCVKLWAELGLTPSSRSRVTTTPPGGSFSDDTDVFAEFDDPPTTSKPM